MLATAARALLLSAMIAFALCGCRQRGTYAGAGEPSSQYVVQPGDTLTILSARYDVPIHALITANHLRTNTLTPGQLLLLPGVPWAPPADQAPAPEAPEQQAAASVEDTSWYIPRSRWAVEPIDLGNIVPMTKPYRITVHHSGDEGDVVGDPIAMLRHFEHIHIHFKHWACIGYHFIIAPDGRVFEGRPMQYQGAHAVGDNNIGNIGICLIGDFDRQRVPEVQEQVMIEVLDRLRSTYGIERAQVFGHEEFKNTHCPGKYLMPIVVAYRGRPAHPVADR
jgi:LysM repeat protein